MRANKGVFGLDNERIEIMSSINRAKAENWDKSLEKFIDSTYFQTTNYAQTMESTFSWKPVFLSMGDSAQFLFFLKESQVFGVKFVSAFSYGAPCALNDELYGKCLEMAVEYAKSHKAFSLSFHSEKPYAYSSKRAEVVICTEKPLES